MARRLFKFIVGFFAIVGLLFSALLAIGLTLAKPMDADDGSNAAILEATREQNGPSTSLASQTRKARDTQENTTINQVETSQQIRPESKTGRSRAERPSGYTHNEHAIALSNCVQHFELTPNQRNNMTRSQVSEHERRRYLLCDQEVRRALSARGS